MNILFVGDVYGSLGRKALEKYIPMVKLKEQVDMIIANGENAANGNGINAKIYQQLTEKLKVDCITMGNHTYGNKDLFTFINRADKLIRPLNFHESNPGVGWRVFNIGGKKVAVINLIGQIFMSPVDSPFIKMEEMLDEIKKHADIIFVDFHAEATSEKIAMGHFLDGKVSAVVGTHTHVPTKDARILERKTAYITDVGMNGPLDGIIGVKKERSMNRIIYGKPERFEPLDTGAMQFNAVLIDIDNTTGKARSIKQINIME